MLIQRENLFAISHEVIPLLNAEYEEVGKLRGLPFAIAWESILALATQGRVAYYTVRNDSGALIGHAGFILHYPNQHAASFTAHNIVYYLTPEQRRGSLALNLIKDCEEDLLSIGVQAIDMTSVPTFQTKKGGLGKLYRFMGYKPIEVIYRKVLTPNNGGMSGRRRRSFIRRINAGEPKHTG